MTKRSKRNPPCCFGAVAAVSVERLSPIQAPREGHDVVPAYRLVRHPIYGGLLLLAIGWSVVLSPIALVVTALLAVVLELKARYEESMLAERYPEYKAYRRRVRWRFVPGVR